jgi:signal peptidase I
MGVLTGLLYGVLAVYLGGWYLGKWIGDFALLLFVLSVVTLLFWLGERYYFKPRRERAAATFTQQEQQRREALAAQGITQVDTAPADTRERLLAQPWWLDWTAGLFPVIITVFLLRSFLVEPFKIPSGSMMPTLLVGDLILVNKFDYGIRLPVINKKIVDIGEPKRGDVMVFRYPNNPSIDYIKRVVGLPGDHIAYLDKRLYVNGQLMSKERLPDFYNDEPNRMMYAQQYLEDLTGVKHRILNYAEARADMPYPQDFPHRENCQYDADGYRCTVPRGEYFMMGDNRDDSEDSRAWGFVPEANIVGRAFFVWMNFSDFKRIGRFQ